MRKRGLLRQGLNWLAGITAGVLILLAILVGLARLLLPLAPDYQDEIRRFATEATGFDVRFGSLRASWPLTGPEIRFSDVRIAMPVDRRPVFDARELTVGVSLRRLLLDRKLQPGRIGVRGSTVRVERLPAGQWVVNSVFLDELLRRPRSEQLPRLDLRFRDIDLQVTDNARVEPRIGLDIRQLDLTLGPRTVEFAAEFDGRDGLGAGLELAGTVPSALLPSGRPAPAGADRTPWEVRLQGTDVDLARWLRVLANQAVPLTAGRGDIELQAGLAGPVPMAVDLDLELGPTTWTGGAPGGDFDRLEIGADWARDGGGWTATLRRFVAVRGGRARPAASGSVRYRPAAGDQPGSLLASADDLRLQDLWPLVRSLAGTEVRRLRIPERLEGDVDNLRVEAVLATDKPADWTAEGSVRGLGLVMPAGGWGVTGVTGVLRADEAGGRLELDSGGGLLRFPTLFRTDLRTTGARGKLGWKRSPDGFEVYGEDLLITTPDVESRARVRVVYPTEGPVFLDVDARFVASSAPAGVNYLPLRKFRPNVVQWLDRAIVAGSVPNAELLWQGPLRDFPYEDGGGRFRAEFTVADAIIDYADNWPRVESATGTVVIDRVTLTSVENRGTIGGLPFNDAAIRVPNLIHDAELGVNAASGLQLGQILAFLRQTPLATTLGPALEAATGSGPVAAAIDLRLPIGRPKDYRLQGTFELGGARLGLKGVDFGLTALEGSVKLDRERLAAERVKGRFLDEPVQIALRPASAGETALAEVAEVRGETPTAKLAAAFSLPYADQLDGRVAWDATVKIPLRRGDTPLTVDVRSGLGQFVSRLPAPLAKPAGAAEPLRMEVRLPEPGRLQLAGDVERGVSWALQFVSSTKRGRSGWRLERGALASGRARAALPAEPGLEIGGSFASLRFEDWFAGGRGGSGQASSLIRRINVEADRFAILGRQFTDARIDARRAGDEWRVAVRGPEAAGTVTVPVGPDAPIVLDMDRLYLVATDPAAGNGAADPRSVPAIRATVGDFVLKDMKLGKAVAEVAQRGDGIVVDPLTMAGKDFRVTGDATWVVEGNDLARQRSELRLKVDSTDIAPTLVALGYDPVVKGEKASVTLDLFWPGGPSDDFLNAAGGRVVVNLDKGRLLPVEPGSGRLVGLLSIAALPRRLGFDFSDVVDKGLAFDRVQGEFRLDRGNAFTCNLGLQGPAADIGILGRVSIPERSYDQLAVVRPHVSDALGLGGFVGGPVVGSTVLLISQIFRKPLSTLGESYYRVGGGWNDPVVTKVQKSEVDLTPFRDCERYLAEVLKQLPPEAELTR